MDKILAKVGNLTVTENEVNEFIDALGQRGASYKTPEGKKAVLSQIVGNKLLLLDAQRNLFEAEPAFRQELARLKENLLVSYAAEKIFSSVSVSDKEAEEYYNQNQERFETGETVNASHILVDSEEKANDIYAEISSGAKTFEECALEYSSCPSKANGGNLGDFSRGQMVPEFDSAVFSMQIGEITDKAVKTQFGYHLIKLNSKSEKSTIPYAEVSDRLKEMLVSEKQRKAYESKINQLKIMYPVDMMTF